ncbi:ubiquitin-like protein pmt3/smt3 [Apiospora marii]|uniref:Ubiquitin-like protein pmt3/smt3 n=1 Tax=Apiospora marii TaxID=335849 RepID=A0ABR1RCU7_9PEZI
MSGERVDHFLHRIKSEQNNAASGSGAAGGSTAGNKDQGDDNGDDVITIKFKDSARYQNETPWKVKRSDNLWTHLQNYAQSIKAINVPFPGPLRFVTFDGEAINKEHTPASLDMEDGDVVDMMHEQIGGKPCLASI